jgi:Ca2+-transporting ATPase
MMITRVGLLTGCMGLIVCGEFYWMLHNGGYSEVEARNLVLLQFVLFENIVVLNSRSETLSIFSQPLMQNPLLVFGTIAAQGIHIAAMYIPGLSDVLYIHPVTLAEWGALLGIAFIVMAVIEMEKWIRRSYTKRRKAV